MGAGDGLGGCHACIKYLMFAFNFIFWLIGCGLVGVGIWVLVDEKFNELADESQFAFLQYGGIALITIGGIVMVVGFFGCCGAIRESQCLLVMFFICMLLLFIVLVAAGVFCLIFKDRATNLAVEAFDAGVKDYSEDNVIKYVDLVQKFFDCCGTQGKGDYLDKAGGVPKSCGAATKGCATVVPDKLSEHVTMAAGIALGAGAVMLLGMIFSMMLCCAIRDSD